MIKCADEVKDRLEEHGISLETFQEMVTLSAIVTHSLGNRRYRKWLLDIRDGVCNKMTPWIKERVHYGSTDMVAHEDCDFCDGEGCQHCDHVGQVRVLYKRKRSSNEKVQSKPTYATYR